MGFKRFLLLGAVFLAFLEDSKPLAQNDNKAEEVKTISILKSIIKEQGQERIKKPGAMAWFIHEECQKHNIDPFLILAVIQVESNFRPNVVSKKGAIGLMQIMPDTGREIASHLKWRKYSKKDLLNPFKNIRAGIFYLKKMKTNFKSNKLLYLTAYYMGTKGLIEAQKSSSRLSYRYAKRVLSAYKNLKARKTLLAANF